MSAPSLGFHYFDDTLHYRARDLEACLPELRALGASWLTLPASLDRAIPETFLTGLLAAGIQPVIHTLRAALPLRRLDLAALQPLLHYYARLGLSYVCIFDRPNARSAWPGSDWARPGLLDRFIDAFIPVALAEQAAWLQPVFPALEPSGDYPDSAFLESALDGIIRRGLRSLAESLVFAFYDWADRRPSAWASSTRTTWLPAVNNESPTAVPSVTEHPTVLRLRRLSASVSKLLGGPRPLLCLAGGALSVEPEAHSSANIKLANLILTGGLPSEAMNYNFWLLSSSEKSPGRDEAWYREVARQTPGAPSDGTVLPVVGELKKLAALHRSASLPAGAGKGFGPRPIYHYLLLPTFEWGTSDWNLDAIKGYVHAFRPTVGFSLDEAGRASHVTLLGNEESIGEDTARNLQQQGCIVERIAGAHPQDVLAQLDERVRAGRRFARTPLAGA